MKQNFKMKINMWKFSKKTKTISSPIAVRNQNPERNKTLKTTINKKAGKMAHRVKEQLGSNHKVHMVEEANQLFQIILDLHMHYRKMSESH